MAVDTGDPRNPALGYVVVAVSLIAGMLTASAFGQRPSSEQRRHPAKTQELVAADWSPNHRPLQRRWILGVHADATTAGYLIRHVEPHSTASQAGLEAGDRLVAIDGQQVGLIGHRLVNLSDTLQRAGGEDGRVGVLVQNRRNRRLVSLSVTLRQPAQHLGN